MRVNLYVIDADQPALKRLRARLKLHGGSLSSWFSRMLEVQDRKAARKDRECDLVFRNRRQGPRSQPQLGSSRLPSRLRSG